MTRKNTSLPTLNSRSLPSTPLSTAIDDRRTIISTAKRSSTMSTARTSEANFFCRIPMSVNALMMMVVDDIDSMPPRKRQLIWLKCSRCPTAKPMPIMPMTIVSAVTTADPPELSSLRKLNSRPRENSRTTMPICAQKSMFSSVVTEGRYVKLGLARKPATI